MCGIFGIYNADYTPIDCATVRCATLTLRHRGPDDSGYLLSNTLTGAYCLYGDDETDPRLNLPHLPTQGEVHYNLAFGFRRLAILDLSPTGHQPMQSEDGRYWIIFNGEIYNYLEIRAELATLGHRFRSSSDTEIILAAYRQWGVDCLSHFNGMWAFAIWDHSQQHLFIARDRFGVKPLYYTWNSHRFAFSSEMKALWRSRIVAADPDPSAIALYIAGYPRPDPLATSMLRNVWQLPPAHYLRLNLHEGITNVQPIRYWQLNVNAAYGQGEPQQDIVDQFRTLLIDSVRLRLRADVPIGTCLSGGLDSSAIVCIANRLIQDEHVVEQSLIGEHQKTFSACYDNSNADERHHIEKVLAWTGAERNYVFPTKMGLRADLRQLVYHQDEPFMSTSIYAQWCIMQRVRERGVKVLLDGQGADEILAGYTPYSTFLSHAWQARGFGVLARSLQDIHQISGLPYRHLIMTTGHGLLPLNLRKVIRQTFRPTGQYCLQPDLYQVIVDQQHMVEETLAYTNLNHLLYDQQINSLPTLLRYEDRNSMAHSVEGRTPFVDYRLVEFSFQQPAFYKLYQGWTKWILRQATKSLMPETIVWRRDKVGFATPEHEWLIPILQDPLFFASDSPLGTYVNLPELHKVFSKGLAKTNVHTMRQMWRWLNLEIWLQVLQDKAP